MDEEKFQWPQAPDYRTGEMRDAYFGDYEFHGSYFSVCPVCSALVDNTDTHKAWHVKVGK